MDLKRLFAGMAAALLAAVSFFPLRAEAISAKNAILVDGLTGRVIYEKNADQRSLIASTTKIMTALVVCEQCNVLDRMRIPKEAVGIEGSSMYLQEGEVLTIQELLYGLMLRSGNDAATALAIYCGGTVEGFAQLMNDKAHRLGMEDSHFENPHGLDSPGHYSTARDMAKLTVYAMKNPIFAKTVSTKTVTAGGRTLQNHNKLLWQLPGADGVKTGYTKAAGRILVSSAVRSDRRLIMVTMDDPNDWADHKEMMERGFSDYQVCLFLSKGDRLGYVEVEGGESDRVSLVADSDFSYAVAKNEKLRVCLNGSGFVYAPVAAGQNAGFAHIFLDETPVGKVPLVYGQTVEQEEETQLPWWQRVIGGLRS